MSKLHCFWDFYIILQLSLKRKQIFSLVPYYYGLALLRTLNLPPRVSAITGVDYIYRKQSLGAPDIYSFCHVIVLQIWNRSTDS